MKKTEKNKEIPTPTLEEVKSWVLKDLQASHYFLGLLLRHPEAIDAAAKEIYEAVLRKENGPAIEHENQAK